MARMALAVAETADVGGYRYFSPHACVFAEGDQRSVFVGGTLVGSYDVDDKATRNAILVKLSEDPKVHLGKLAEAFGLGREQLRNLQKKYQAEGLAGVVEIKTGGRQRVVTPALRRRLFTLFDGGASINVAHAKINRRVSRTMVGRTRKAWRLERELEREASGLAMAVPATPTTKQCDFGAQLTPTEDSDPPADRDHERERGMSPDERVVTADEPVADAASGDCAEPSCESGLVVGPSLHDSAEASSELVIGAKRQLVQHAGAFIVLALLQSFGLYRHVENLRKDAIADGDVDGRYLERQR